MQADPQERTNLAGRADLREVEFDLRTRLLNWMIDSTETDQIQPRWLDVPDAAKCNALDSLIPMSLNSPLSRSPPARQ